MTANNPLIEVCVEGIDGLLAAQEAGADRVELCASLGRRRHHAELRQGT